MRKTILSLFALLSMGGSVMAGDKPVITVADVEALPGETVEFAVNLVDGKADTYTAMTLYAQFPTTGFATVSGATGATVSSAWPGASGVVGDIDAEGLATIPFASSEVIAGSAVENLVTVSFTVADDVELGEYPVTLKGTMFEYGTDSKDYADDVTFKVIVTDRITLDENATTAPKVRSGVNVKVKRTIKAGEWSTLCVPFAMTKTQATAAFGDDVVIKAYSSYTAEIDEVTFIPSAITLNFTDYVLSALKKIQAGTPYLIKTSQDIESFDVDNVNVTATTTDVSGPETEYGLAGKFSGVLAKTKVPENGLFISGNKFYYSKGNTDIMAFRGWFDLEAIYNVALPVEAPVYLSFDGGTTRISMTENDNQKVDGTYYNLSGQKVLNPTKGLFIKNGKKYVIK